ncbi:MAG: dihydrodipicolinate synthase family protein, partial [Henriciella sp.]
LAKLPNRVGIKDATGDLGRVSMQNAGTLGEQFFQISGDDPSALGHRSMGGLGCISVSANVAPAMCAAMHMAVDDGDLQTAIAIEARMIDLHLAMFASPSPGPAKYALSCLGLCEPDVRLPITPPDTDAREAIDTAMAKAGVL